MFPSAALERLGRAKQTYDPDGLFRANHAIDPA
jgi:FAD/FMN-containing dehydrogenase